MNTAVTEQLASRVRELREEANLTQEEVAKKLNMSRATYNAVEAGKSELSTSDLANIAGLYNVTIPELFDQSRNNDKFIQMYFYVLNKFKEGVPKTKLAKLLYLADFRNYYEALEPMSGVYYIRRQYGPLADCFLEMTDELYDSGKVSVDKLSEGAFMIKANSIKIGSDLLSDEEKKRIDEICDLWHNKSTKEIVNFTHEQKPWASCREGEYIPYELIIQEDPEHVYAPVG